MHDAQAKAFQDAAQQLDHGAKLMMDDTPKEGGSGLGKGNGDATAGAGGGASDSSGKAGTAGDGASGAAGGGVGSAIQRELASLQSTADSGTGGAAASSGSSPNRDVPLAGSGALNDQLVDLRGFVATGSLRGERLPSGDGLAYSSPLAGNSAGSGGLAGAAGSTTNGGYGSVDNSVGSAVAAANSVAGRVNASTLPAGSAGGAGSAPNGGAAAGAAAAKGYGGSAGGGLDTPAARPFGIGIFEAASFGEGRLLSDFFAPEKRWPLLLFLLLLAGLLASGMRKRRYLALAPLVGVLFLSLGLSGKPSAAAPQPAEEPMLAYTEEATALAAARVRSVPILIDFGAAWCESCQQFDRAVLSDAEVRQKLGRFVVLKIDVTEDNEINRKKMSRYGVEALPTLVFLDQRGNTSRVRGAMSKARFLELLAAH